FHPLFINTHFNHPREVTAESADACRQLADAGIPLGNQTVLLRGVNDSSPVLRELFQKLLKIRVRPYYLHQMDLTRGAGHFRTPLSCGLRIMAELRGTLSGLAIPTFVVDLPGGKGKIPLLPEYGALRGNQVILRSPCGEEVVYPDLC
ncbi:MAG: lysine 2,3-aminomutase, partial [Desulfuromonadaceae bacterium]|nr:lysine 2,3-aminomutase [Desulfuromonadaceae bacterium]